MQKKSCNQTQWKWKGEFPHFGCDNGPVQFSFTPSSESVKKKPKSKETQPKKGHELHILIEFIIVSLIDRCVGKHSIQLYIEFIFSNNCADI